MKKNPIGILDEGIQGINFFNYISKKYKYEDFIYVNDLKNYPYEGKEEEAINRLVSEKIEFMIMSEVKAIIIISNAIVEYCSEYLNRLSIPVIRIDEAIIDYVNKKYDQKNIALFGKESIIKANIYQKNFKYNHLYNVYSDEFEEIILNKEVKTSKSFNKMKDATKHINNRDIDIFITLESYLENLYTEINEYVKAKNFGNLSEIIIENAVSKKIFEYQKGSGNRIVCTDLKEKEFRNKVFWLDCKYKYFTIDNLKDKINKQKVKEDMRKAKKEKKNEREENETR